MKARIYLSRRNLLTLLSKLQRRSAGELTACTIIKNDNVHRTYRQSMKSIEVVAVADEDYYSQRAPGAVHDSDTPKPDLAQAILKLKRREDLDEQELAVVDEFLLRYGLR